MTAGYLERMHNLGPNNCQVWAVGGGKGGIGKSFIISSIAYNLATRDKKIVIIDADFGGANLHSFLNVAKPAKTLTDFFEKNISLQELITETNTPNLGMVAGHMRSFAPSNINYAQKLKLFKQIRELEADIVLIDLGAGSDFNIVDTFLLADKKIVVTLPEITAMENMYSFLKHAFFRRLMRVLTENKLKYVLDNALKNRQEFGLGKMQELLGFLKKQSAEVEEIVNQALSGYDVNIVVNQTKNNQDIILGNSVKSVCLKYLGFQSRYIGYVEQDDSIPLTINKRQIYLKSYPTSRCAEGIVKITGNLLNNSQVHLRV